MIKILIFIATAIIYLLADFNILTSKENYFLDAVVFQSEDKDSARIDVYIVIPYELLSFENVNNKFVSNIALNIKITDKSNNTIDSKRLVKTVIAEDYSTSQGADADFLKLYYRFPINVGTYTVSTDLKDEFSGNNYERQREVTVIEFNKFSFSLSGVLLLSQIEEIDNRFKITPFISDNIGNLEDKFFAFFEIYNKFESKTVGVKYLLKKDEEIISEGQLKKIEAPVGNSQNFITVDISDLSLSGEYLLQVIAYKTYGETVSEQDIIAITQRSVKHNESDLSLIENDIEKAIRMLRYVATETQIEKIEKQKTEELKKEKFKDFWKELDPTPNTSFNEAKSEYYQRIKYANDQFKSYTEGWLTDMGMVFIVLGPPMQVDKQSSFGNNVEYRQWQYGSNRTFLFADKNGFGNFRLERPYLFNEKYRYRK